MAYLLEAPYVTGHVGPLREAQVRGDNQAGLLVELAQQVEQQRTTDLAEGQVAELIEDEQIDMHQSVRQAPLFTIELFLLVGWHVAGQEPSRPQKAIG